MEVWYLWRGGLYREVVSGRWSLWRYGIYREVGSIERWFLGGGLYGVVSLWQCCLPLGVAGY